MLIYSLMSLIPKHLVLHQRAHYISQVPYDYGDILLICIRETGETMFSRFGTQIYPRKSDFFGKSNFAMMSILYKVDLDIHFHIIRLGYQVAAVKAYRKTWLTIFLSTWAF